MGVCYLLCGELHSHKRLGKKKTLHNRPNQERKKEFTCGKNEVVPSKGKHIFVGTRVEIGIMIWISFLCFGCMILVNLVSYCHMLVRWLFCM